MENTLPQDLGTEQSGYGMRRPATLCLDHLKGTPVQSLQLCTPQMESTLLRDHMTRQSEFGMLRSARSHLSYIPTELEYILSHSPLMADELLRGLVMARSGYGMLRLVT